MNNGNVVARFEQAFAEYVGARYAIALCNGTATLHTALEALWTPGQVAVPPLTMSATTIAVLHAKGTPHFVDIDPDTWLMAGIPLDVSASIGVSLYGLHWNGTWLDPRDGGRMDGRAIIDDAAQTLAPFAYPDGSSYPDFKSYSFQASKILALGEGGMLVTNDEDLARRAREFSSLGYRMDPDQPRIDPSVLKHPTYERHHSLGWNYRMSDLVAEWGVWHMAGVDDRGDDIETPDTLRLNRIMCATRYADAIDGCLWITPQHVPEGWVHDYWCYAVALESAELWEPFTEAVVRHGGEMPYGAWRLTYQEPAFRHLAEDGCCPVAEDLQPRIVQFQTNKVESAKVNADAVAKAIQDIG